MCQVYMEILLMIKLVAKVAGIHGSGKLQFSSSTWGHSAARQVPSICSDMVLKLGDCCAAA